MNLRFVPSYNNDRSWLWWKIKDKSKDRMLKMKMWILKIAKSK